MVEALRIETAPASPDRSRPKGGSGTVIYYGQIDDLELNPDVKGSLWYGDGRRMGVAQEMMRDAHVKRSVEAIIDPLLAAYWDFDEPSKEPAEVEASDYACWDFFENNNWERILRLGTTGLVRDGVSYFEWTDVSNRRVPTKRFPLHPGRGLGVSYSKAHHRPASTVYRFLQSAEDVERCAGIEQWLTGSDVETPGTREINLEGGDLLWRLTWDQEGADFAGLAPLRAAYSAFKCKRLLITLDMMRHEREGLGIPEITGPEASLVPEARVDPSVAEEEVVRKILRDIRSHESAYIYLPGGYSFQWRTSGGQSTGLREAIEQCNRDIAYNLGVAWMLLGIAGKTGSWALAQEQRGHYVLSLEKFARFWESALNNGLDGWSPVERLIRRNYGPDVGIPKLVARNMPTRDWSKVLPLLPMLAKARLLKSDAVLRAFVRQVAYLPVEDPETAEELAVVEAVDALNTPTPEPDDAEGEETTAAEERDRAQAEQARIIATLERRLEVAERAIKFLESIGIQNSKPKEGAPA